MRAQILIVLVVVVIAMCVEANDSCKKVAQVARKILLSGGEYRQLSIRWRHYSTMQCKPEAGMLMQARNNETKTCTRSDSYIK